MVEREKKIIVHVQRSNPKVEASSRYQTFEILAGEEITLLMALQQIRETIDETLSFRDYCCMTGPVCGSCLMKVDGRTRFACALPVSGGDELTVEPLGGYQVIKDLVVDFNSKTRGV
jgi:succinate dehydrogenase/fumarate reductase iron-sulfur protein